MACETWPESAVGALGYGTDIESGQNTKYWGGGLRAGVEEVDILATAVRS